MLGFASFRTLAESFMTEGERLNLQVQPWSAPKISTDDAVLATYVLAQDKAQQLKPRLESILKRASSGQAKILVGIKSFDSFRDKVVNRGRSADTVYDVLRAAVLTDSQAETEAVVHALKRSNKFTEVEFKDKGSDPKFGYFGSYHLKLVLDGMICEVQVMTRRLWTYKEWGHQFYNLYRSGGNPDPTLLRKSKMIFSLGNLQLPKGIPRPTFH